MFASSPKRRRRFDEPVFDCEDGLTLVLGSVSVI